MKDDGGIVFPYEGLAGLDGWRIRWAVRFVAVIVAALGSLHAYPVRHDDWLRVDPIKEITYGFAKDSL